MILGTFFYQPEFPIQVSVLTKINAKIPQGLKVTLSKTLYEQIIETTR